jgi:hypothetical protein
MANPAPGGGEIQDLLRHERQLSVLQSISAEARSALSEMAKAIQPRGDLAPIENKARWRTVMPTARPRLKPR